MFAGVFDMKNHTNKNRKRRIRWSRVFVLLAVFVLMMSWAINAFADSDEAYDCAYIVIHSGDNMWDLIQEVNPDYHGDMNAAIYETCKLNDMDSAALRAGQSILIPRLP